jgi:HPt (histidine-containing phosphotransfer) domain-containing protein
MSVKRDTAARPATGRQGRGKRQDEADAVDFPDHSVITPRRNLTDRAKRVRVGADLDLDAIERAEAAIQDLAVEFDGWMAAECDRLHATRLAVHAQGYSVAGEDLHRAAHDIKGQAETLGYPLAGAAAASLCRLIEATRAPAVPPLDLVDSHVDAVRAIVRQAGAVADHRIARELVETLSARVASEIADPTTLSTLPTVPAPPL